MGTLAGLRAAVLATDGFEESTLVESVRALRGAGAEARVVAPRSGEIRGLCETLGGRAVTVDCLLHAVRAHDYDALLLAGGALSADALRMRADVQALVRDIHQAGKPIAAFGHAVWILISSGLVPDHSLTGPFSLHDDICNAGGTWLDRAVVADRRLVTARDLDDLSGFLAATVRLFEDAVQAQHRRAG